MTNLNKLYIKSYCNSHLNIIINKPERIPIKYLPNDYSKENYTIIERLYDIQENLYNCEDSFSDFHIESCYDRCYLCKCNINYYNMNLKYKLLEKTLKLNDNIFKKLENILVNNKNNNNLFVYQSKINLNSYIYFYYHLCETCYKHSLYYWSLSNKNKYPSSRIDGYRFINHNDRFVPEIKKAKNIEIINKLDIPNIYICNNYNCINKMYTYLSD